MTTPVLTTTDVRILTALQQDGRITNQTLADQIGMSASPAGAACANSKSTATFRGTARYWTDARSV